MAKTESFARMQKRDNAPAFTLPGIDGRTYSLADFSGREGMLIVFICDHCPYVKARMGQIGDLHKAFGERIAIVGVNSSDPSYPGESAEDMKAFAAEYGVEFPYLIDEDGAVAKRYGATCTPDPFLFDKEGKLAFHGRISDALEPKDPTTELTMRQNIETLLAGGAIEPWFNPSLGCSIKFKGQ